MKFEKYLEQQFMLEHPETLDDEFPDKFEAWLGRRDVEDIMEYAQEAINQSAKQAREEVIEYATQEMNDAKKESQIKMPNNPFRKAINQAEFGRYQAFRDLIKELSQK